MLNITTSAVIRLALDQAATVEEGLELFVIYGFHASIGYMIHFAIADVKRNSAAVEYINNRMGICFP